MVNTEDFIKRLEIILDYYGVNASAFADKIGVQRSSLSHLLSGRNKPSLDFILKILEVYPEVDLYWILNGKGNFPENNTDLLETDSMIASPAISATENTKEVVKEDLFSNTTIENNKINAVESQSKTTINLFEENIEKIVFFYKDGTFKTFNPNTKK